MSTLRDEAKRVLPWVVAAGMVYYVFTRVPLAQAWEAAQDADLALFLSVVGAAILTWFAIESTLYAWLFTRFNAPVDRSEARALRGMSYLLTPINWNVGKAAVILPHGVLFRGNAEFGMPVPDRLDVKVVENADDCVHITLPAPPAEDTDLSDDALSNAAGGGTFGTTFEGGGDVPPPDSLHCMP